MKKNTIARKFGAAKTLGLAGLIAGASAMTASAQYNILTRDAMSGEVSVNPSALTAPVSDGMLQAIAAVGVLVLIGILAVTIFTMVKKFGRG